MTDSTLNNVATVRLVDRKTRVVEVMGPDPVGSRRPTDRELYTYSPQRSYADYVAGPRPIGLCIAASERRAKFHIEESARGDRFLDRLTRHPKTPVRLAKPYGVKGWVVED